MKKLFALLLLPSLAFAGKIGENYVGAQIGFADVGMALLLNLLEIWQL
jgi:hypothetical protein